MKESNQILNSLLSQARKAPTQDPSVPYGFATRVVAHRSSKITLSAEEVFRSLSLRGVFVATSLAFASFLFYLNASSGGPPMNQNPFIDSASLGLGLFL